MFVSSDWLAINGEDCWNLILTQCSVFRCAVVRNVVLIAQLSLTIFNSIHQHCQWTPILVTDKQNTHLKSISLPPTCHPDPHSDISEKCNLQPKWTNCWDILTLNIRSNHFSYQHTSSEQQPAFSQH